MWVPQSTGIIRGTEFQTRSSTALPYRARTVHGWVDNAEPSLAPGGPCLSIFCLERSFFPQQSCQRSQGPETSAGSWLMPMTHFKTLHLPSSPRSKQRGGALELGPKAQCVLLWDSPTQVLPCRSRTTCGSGSSESVLTSVYQNKSLE